MTDTSTTNGVGPHPQPWPNDPRFDTELLTHGDRRNVLDKYRYWTVDAIKADLDQHRLPIEIAIENVQYDYNIGTIVRNANAFNAAKVHIIGRRQWNRRGAMVTDAYMHLEHHLDAKSFKQVMNERGVPIVAVDIVPGSLPIESTHLPQKVVLVFGAEGPGLSEELKSAAESIIHISQYGSTRSVNVGVASGIALYEWTRQHQPPLVTES